MKTAISLPDDVFKKAERLAKRLKLSRSELYRKALAEYMRQHAQERLTERLDEVYAREPSAPDGTLQDIQQASLRHEDW
jgi:metal-responsive CopG/Arc/MetJ family transcriptional regulator